MRCGLVARHASALPVAPGGDMGLHPPGHPRQGPCRNRHGLHGPPNLQRITAGPLGHTNFGFKRDGHWILICALGVKAPPEPTAIAMSISPRDPGSYVTESNRKSSSLEPGLFYWCLLCSDLMRLNFAAWK